MLLEMSYVNITEYWRDEHKISGGEIHEVGCSLFSFSVLLLFINVSIFFKIWGGFEKLLLDHLES